MSIVGTAVEAYGDYQAGNSELAVAKLALIPLNEGANRFIKNAIKCGNIDVDDATSGAASATLSNTPKLARIF